MKTFQELLNELQACSEAKKWAGEMTIEEVVEKCERGDWLLWLAKKVNIDDRNLTLAKGLCANTVRHLMTDERSIAAVDAAIAYGKGEIDREELNAASAAAYASYVAYDAAYDAAYAAYAASAYDAAVAAKKENQMQTADICRNIIGKEIIEKVNELLK